MDKAADQTPAALVADFYNGLIAQEIPRDVAVALTSEWIKAMMSFAKDQSQQSDVLVQWLASQTALKKD